MKKTTKNILIGLGIFLLAIFFYLYFRTDSAGQYDDFAKCLTENNATMYGTDWCSYCKKQKDLFGDSFKNINFVDCDKNREECLIAGVQGYPTWKINEENYPGLQSLEKLSNLTECSLER